MTSAQPPIPPTADESLSVPVPHNESALLGAHATHERRPSTTGSHMALGRWRHFIGLCLILLTVFLWTASNFLASTIFADNTYSKPYLVTYVNTAFFIIPLVPILIFKAMKHPGEFYCLSNSWRNGFGEYSAIKKEEDSRPILEGARDTRRSISMSASQERLLGGPMQLTKALSTRGGLKITKPGPTSLQETARLSLEFCLLWFLANYFVAACLEYTTVASSTILTSTSSVFTLLFGALLHVEKLTYRKLLGVLASMTGIVLISSMDLSGNNDENRGDFPHKSRWELFVGDSLAFLSAVMYGIYAVFMKKRVGDESRVNMPLFFGMVGLINVLLLWPGLIILHFTGVETFKLPPNGKVVTIIAVNSVTSLISDLAWAYAVLLTSPIVVTVGLSLTIPLSLIGQIILNSQTASVLYWTGALIVVLSFIFVNHESKAEQPIEDGTVLDEYSVADPTEGRP